MDAYCLKCKTKRDIRQPVQKILANGKPSTQGFCSICGTKMSRLGAMTPAPDR